MSRSTFLISAVSLAALLLLAGCNGSDNSTGNTALPTGSKPDASKPDTSVPDPTQPDKGKKYAKQQVTQGDTFSYQYTLKPGQTLRVIQPATLGNVSVANGLVIYQAPLALTGTDQFKLEVIDGLSALSLDWMIRVNKPTPRFSVAAVNDQVAAKAWQCVSDAETHQGVTWLTAIHPNTETFSWQNWEATLPGFAADCSLSGALSGKACTTNNLIDYANQQQWCGKTDWRLPYAYEMQNLTSEQDFALDRNQAAIDPFFFPHVGFETYWLQNDASAQQADNIAYRYSFGANRKKSLSQNKRKPASVILVSGSYRDPSLPNQQIKPQAEETSFIRLDNAGQPLARNRQQDDYQDSPWRCLDDMRGLVRDNLYLRDKRFSYVYWLIPNSSDATSTLRNYVSDSSVSNCAQTECSIEAALQVINRSKQCGRSDWRLPTADELALLMHQQVSGGEYKLLYSKSLNSPVAGDYWVATSTETGHGTLKLPMTATLQPTPLTAQNKATQTAKLLLIASEFEPRATEDPRSVRNHTKPDITRLRQAYATHPYHWPAPFVDDIGSYQELGTMSHPVFPNHNPYDEKKVALGKKLFFDPFLSQAQDVACASCHEPKKGWGDGREVSIGHDRQRGKRNAPTIVNSAFLPQLFWDGRAATLEQQALMPIQDPLEMAESLPNLVKRLNAHPNYPTLFDEVFGQGAITQEQLGMALATFQRTIISKPSQFDRFVKEAELGKTDALSDQALWGLDIYRRNGRCANCHMGSEFTNHKFENVGLTYYKAFYEDLGKYNVSGNSHDVGLFKTPSLRDVMNHGPWFHNGLVDTIDGVISMYSEGMASNAPFGWSKYDPNYPKLSEKIRPLNLTYQEAEALKAFLVAITAESPLDSATKTELGQ